MYKNRLQEHAQRSSIPLPMYLTVNEGSPHAPKFKSTVVVDGVSFHSPETSSQRKEAEQNAAKIALEGLSKKTEQEGFPLISSDTTFCKSILHEFSVKMNMEKPEYKCSQSEGLLPTFISSLELSGKVFQGTVGRNKKEAHQLAARATIESILDYGDSQQKTIISQIIRSKGKLYATLGQTKEIKDTHAAHSQPQDVHCAAEVMLGFQNAPKVEALVKKEIYSGLTQSPQVNTLSSDPLTFGESLETSEKKSKSTILKIENSFAKKEKIRKRLMKSKFKKSSKGRS